MKITSWNVNSVNARIEHLIQFIKKDKSDIYLLQELKCIDELFPYDEIKKNGYNCYVNGQKAWNGVAILSKNKLSIKFTQSKNILVTRERHRIKLNHCLNEIDNFLKKDKKKDIEMAAEDLRLATRHLGEIVGKVDVEEILGSIFKDFCIGK